ncbi:MAG TPA: hypothetical protein VM582_03400 [Candidatus Thermoplasmatota archaeon]|nr:hypothetical protein [Candidatus Thermoplasmatota archaeon]
MATGDPLTRSVDAVAGRTGLTRDAVAILFIVAGVIILIWPAIIPIALGLLLIVVGVVWLVTSYRERQATRPPP